MGRKREFTDEVMVKALIRTRGLVYLAADIVGCHYDTIYDRAKVSPAVASAMRRERGKVVDVAESKLFGYVEDGEAWAIQFALRNLGKDRGYVERQEVEQRNKTTLELVEEIVDAGDGPKDDPPA